VKASREGCYGATVVGRGQGDGTVASTAMLLIINADRIAAVLTTSNRQTLMVLACENSGV
jgi:hypothetical protein